ncbi:hypothetical protein LXL04_038595 [Taraxacum kok-saghyz]
MLFKWKFTGDVITKLITEPRRLVPDVSVDHGVHKNLIDASNIAALAALSIFRRPECTLGGEELLFLPLSNIGCDGMGGSMTAILNTNGDICAIQKAGGEGVLQSVIMQCLRITSVKADDITSKIKTAVSLWFSHFLKPIVESYNTKRALTKLKRHNPSLVGLISQPRDFSPDYFSTMKQLLGAPPQNSRSYDQVGGIIHICEVRQDDECPSRYEIDLNASGLDVQKASNHMLLSFNPTTTSNQHEKNSYEYMKNSLIAFSENSDRYNVNSHKGSELAT